MSQVIMYRKNTIDDMLSIVGMKDNDVCNVSETGRGGTFTYDSSRKDENDGGVCFNGWVRDGIENSYVSPYWFGAISKDSSKATINVTAFLNADNFAFNNNKAVGNCSGVFYINDELKFTVDFIGDGRLSTEFHPINFDSVIENYTHLFWDGNKEAFIYERPTKAVVSCESNILKLEGFSIVGPYIGSDDDLNKILPIAGVRVGGISSPTTTSQSRSSLSDIYIKGCHTSFVIRGWINTFTNLLSVGSKIGLFATEFNNNVIDIKIENSVLPMKIYGASASVFNGYMYEGRVTSNPAELDLCKNIVINCVYSENPIGGSQATGGIFKFGMTTPIDSSLLTRKDKHYCQNIQINGLSLSGNIPNTSYNITCDRINKLELNGISSNDYNKELSITENSKNIINNIVYVCYDKRKVNLSKTRLVASPPIQLAPNNTFQYGQSGLGINVTNKVSYEFIKNDTTINNDYIEPLTNGYMCKFTLNEDSEAGTAERGNIYVRFPDMSIFQKCKNITIGAWVYFPKNTANTDSVNTPGQPLAYFFASGDTYPSSQKRMLNYDDWVFMIGELEVPDNVYRTGISVYFTKDDGLITPAGSEFYIDSIYIINGNEPIEYLEKGIFATSDNYFCNQNGSNLEFKQPLQNSGEIGNNIGDIQPNPDYDVGSGLTPKIIASEKNSPYYNNKWMPVFNNFNLLDLPTTNQGAGTWFLDNGVITAGS